MKHNFKYYLHDDYNSEGLVEFLTDPKFGNLSEYVAEQIAEDRPFYEITIECEYDDATGIMKILKAYQ